MTSARCQNRSPSDDPVGHVAAGELFLEGTCLGVGPHEYRHRAQRVPALQLLESIGDPTRLGPLVRADIEPHGFASLVVGEERFAASLPVGGDEGSGGGQDRCGGAVVLLELDHRRTREVAFEGEDIVHLGPTPAIDGLVLITDRGEIAVARKYD